MIAAVDVGGILDVCGTVLAVIVAIYIVLGVIGLFIARYIMRQL